MPDFVVLLVCFALILVIFSKGVSMPQQLKVQFSISIAPPPPPPLTASLPDGSAAQPEPAVNALPAGQVGQPVSAQISFGGGIAPIALAVSSGSLPDGLTLDSTGLLSGVPTSAGAAQFEITATDASA